MPHGMKVPKGAQSKAPQQPILYNAKRLMHYSPEEIDHCERSQAIAKYIEAKTIQSEKTGVTYKTRMQAFSQCIFKKYEKQEVDDFLEQIRLGKLDPYDVLTQFSGFLKEKKGISGRPLSANFRIASLKTIRKFMRFSKIKVTIEDFKELVPLPRKERPDKKPMEKKDIIRYLNGCKNMQLKTTLHILACNGPRPIEPCAVLERDVHLDANPPTIAYQAEYSKMRVARTRPLSQEAANQIRLWLTFKYRTRKTTVRDEKTGNFVKRTITPKRDPDSLLLAMPHLNGKISTPEGVYDFLAESWAELADLVDGKQNRKSGERRKITLKTFRDYVKSEIADSGNSDYSEFLIGHARSTYYSRSEEQKRAAWAKCEPFLTYLDTRALEAKRLATQTELEQEKVFNQRLQEQIANMQKDNDRKYAHVIALIRGNRKLINVKPEELGNLEPRTVN